MLELLAQARFDSTLWEGLFEGLKELELTPEQWSEVLAPLSEQPPIVGGRREAAELLREGMSSEGIPVHLFEEANTVTRNVWQCLDAAEVWVQGDWYFRAINSTAGKLADYWLFVLSRLLNIDGQTEVDQDLILEEMANLVAGHQKRHLVARCIFGRQLAFLVRSCGDWAIEHIVPLLDWNDHPDEAEAMWDGFAGEQRISPQLVDACRDAYQSVFPHIETLHERTRRGLVSQIAVIAVHLGDDALEEWVWPLLRRGKPETRVWFLQLVGSALSDLDASEQENVWGAWLREFWRAWDQGRPQRMTPGDRAALANLAIRATHVFPRCVALMEEWDDGPIAYDDLMLRSLTRGDNLAVQEPEATARFVRRVAELLPDENFEFCHRFHYRIRDLINAGVVGPPMDDVCERLREMGCPGVHKLLERLEAKRSGGGSGGIAAPRLFSCICCFLMWESAVYAKISCAFATRRLFSPI